MAYEYQILEKVKSRIASIKANWGFPASTPILDRVSQAVSQVRARIKALAPGAPAGTTAAQTTQTRYQVEEVEEKPRVR